MGYTNPCSSRTKIHCRTSEPWRDRWERTKEQYKYAAAGLFFASRNCRRIYKPKKPKDNSARRQLYLEVLRFLKRREIDRCQRVSKAWCAMIEWNSSELPLYHIREWKMSVRIVPPRQQNSGKVSCFLASLVLSTRCRPAELKAGQLHAVLTSDGPP